MSNSSNKRKVAVLGGGLAGLSAARSLIEMGFDVTLVEKRPFLGGRAFSFHSRDVDMEVDNGQHVFMGCCTYYIDFLRAINASDDAVLQDSLKAEVVLDGVGGTLSSSPALGPLHLVPSFMRYPHISASDKIRALFGLLQASLTDRRKNVESLDSQTFYDWLKSNHQSERAIENLWNLIILPTLNDDVRRVNADMALMVVQQGLLKKPRDAAIGYARVGLGSIADVRGRRFIKDSGGSVILGKTVRSLIFDGDGVGGARLSGGTTLQADAYISALPHETLLDLLPPELAADPFFEPIAGLTSAPIVNVHLWYDRQVMEDAFIAFLDSPIQWVFNRSLIQGNPGSSGQYVCISLSGAWDFINRPKHDLEDIFEAEMRRVFPLARDAVVRKRLIIKPPSATFRCVPGIASRRPSQVTPVGNLFLAGDWTSTDWPSTMEGAVRSGVYAARALSERLPPAKSR